MFHCLPSFQLFSISLRKLPSHQQPVVSEQVQRSAAELQEHVETQQRTPAWFSQRSSVSRCYQFCVSAFCICVKEDFELNPNRQQSEKKNCQKVTLIAPR